MIDHDLKVLRAVAGDPDAIDGWGAAVGASLGYLQGSGYVTRGMRPEVTAKGRAYLREHPVGDCRNGGKHGPWTHTYMGSSCDTCGFFTDV
ncbi:MAG: hypothetical protein J0H31_07845 [Alphaproteobacteria bacterium]|nr:hypothetical protein [Alphaproteobacteria bacterium]